MQAILVWGSTRRCCTPRPIASRIERVSGGQPWRIATQEPSDIAENIEVYASHLGLGFNPAVLYATADRLANREGEWRPFRRTGWKSVAYGPANLQGDDSRSQNQPDQSATAH